MELFLETNQAVERGRIKLDLVGVESTPIQLEPAPDGMGLLTKIHLRRSGTYRVTEVRSKDTGWNGKPSQAFEIIARPDEAPAVRIIEPEGRSLLLATDDILPLTFHAKDDLALESIAYRVRINNRPWAKFELPGFETPIDRKEALAQFDLDLLKLKLSPNDKVLIKFVAADRKGTLSESEPVELSIISRDLDLSATQVLKLESMMVNDLRDLPIQRNPVPSKQVPYPSPLRKRAGPDLLTNFGKCCPFDERGGRPSLREIPHHPAGDASGSQLLRNDFSCSSGQLRRPSSNSAKPWPNRTCSAIPPIPRLKKLR